MPNAAYSEITNGLVAWWPLSGDVNDHWGTNNATAAETPSYTTGVNGAANTALSAIDGVQCLTSSDSSFPSSSEQRTLSYWVKFVALPNPGNSVGMLSYGSPDNNYNIVTLQNSGGTYYINFNEGFNNFNTFFPVVTNQWYNIAQTYDGGTVFIYINGCSPPTGNQSYRLNTQPGGSFAIGAQIGGSGIAQCVMADVRLYNTCLSAAQLQTNFLAVAYQDVEMPELICLKFLEYILKGEYSEPLNMADASPLNNTSVYYYSNQGTNDNEWADGVNGLANAALHWHGVPGSFMDTHDSSHFGFTNQSYTLSFWVKPFGGGGVFVACGTQNTNGWFANEDSSYNFQFNTCSNGSTDTITGGGAVHNDAYNNILVSVSNGTNILIYRDGVPTLTTTMNMAAPAGTNTLMMGQQNTGTSFGNTLDGNMQFLQIWNRALSAQDAALVYINQQSGIPWPVLGTTALPAPAQFHIISP